MCLVPCSVRKPRSASSSRSPALTAGRRRSGALGRSPQTQSTACLRYSAPDRKASARSSPTTPATPRGQNRLPITKLTAQPIATSSIRTTPTFQPIGTSRLNRTATVTVKAAWPTANGAVPGA